ncbi:hypothetical protein ANCDUO_18831 [Ancylostoma duodenale]|uniref:Ionotropic glutamate receptor L-glutamate and glycine-binding domain-containing protein n=1 Tax=Ancylostoma duodenale TaxID=51022 RepID=A0A0C2FR97_9BILA|nr:hypothetical protein ANCDUO_18831 [Ancylostoma duodenale]
MSFEIKVNKNGSWTGVLGYLANNTADTACLFYQSTDLRDQYFELSYPVTYVSMDKPGKCGVSILAPVQLIFKAFE